MVMEERVLVPKGPRARQREAEEWLTRQGDPPLPDWLEVRDWQMDAVERIGKEYERGARVVFLDAPTGSGKTIMAELVRRQQGVARGLYVCTTKSLQDQVARDFGYARVLKGRANYLPNGLSSRQRDGYRQGDRGMSVPGVTCADCDAGPSGAPLDEQACSYCHDVGECPYLVARQEAIRAPIGVLNTAYLLTALNGGGGKKSPFGDRELVVADECDTLEDQLLGYVELRLGQGMAMLLDVEVPKKGSHMTTIRAWLGDEVLGGIKGAMGKISGQTLEARRNRTRLERLREDVLRVVEREDGWVRDSAEEEGRRGNGGLVLKPVHVSDVGERYLWRHGERWLCMSGTIVSAEAMAEALGLEEAGIEWGVVEMPMRFAKENRRVKYVPVATMSKKSLEETDALAKVKEAVGQVVARHEGENVLVHTHTYKLAKEISEWLQGDGREVVGDVNVGVYLDGRDRDRALGKFRKDGGVLVAASMDRGVDLPGDLCVAGGTRVCTDRLEWVPIEKIQVGDRIIGIDEEQPRQHAYRALRYADVEATTSRWADCFQTTTTHGSIIATAEHPFLAKRLGKRNISTWTPLSKLKPGDRLRWITTPVEADRSWSAGYLAGFFDGEGTVSRHRRTNPTYQAFNISGAQRPGEVMDTVVRLLDLHGFQHNESMGSNGVMHTHIQGRMSDRLRFLSTIRPERLITNTNLDGLNGRDQFAATILSIEPVGKRQVFNLQTSTGTYIAEGFATHNCRVQVIVKMPFANLGDRQVSERLRTPGGQTWYLANTIRTVMQMTGRAVRGESDWAVCYVLDSGFGKVLKDGKRMGMFPQWWLDGLELGRL